jgi:hypothetical protein
MSEPVAPVGTPGEGDGQVGGRRRRRRGSRRRGERLGVSGDVGGPEGTSLGEIAEASSGTVEELDHVEEPELEIEVDLPTGAAPAAPDEPAEPPEALIADVPPPAVVPEAEPAIEPEAPTPEPLAEAPGEGTPVEAEAEGEEAPAPKPRRTRARRVASATPTRTRTRRAT